MKIIYVVSKKARKAGVLKRTMKAIAKHTINDKVFELGPDERLEYHCVVEGYKGPIEVTAALKFDKGDVWCFAFLGVEKR